jgi:hypothetical protein
MVSEVITVTALSDPNEIKTAKMTEEIIAILLPGRKGAFFIIVLYLITTNLAQKSGTVRL